MDKVVEGKEMVWGGSMLFKPIKLLKSGNVQVVTMDNDNETSILFKEHYKGGQEFLARKLKNGKYQVTIPGFLIGQPPDKFQLDLDFFVFK